MREGLYQTVQVVLENAPQTGSTSNALATEPAASSLTNDEVKQLKEDNTRLKYRIKFLLNTIDGAEGKKSQ